MDALNFRFRHSSRTPERREPCGCGSANALLDSAIVHQAEPWRWALYLSKVLTYIQLVDHLILYQALFVTILRGERSVRVSTMAEQADIPTSSLITLCDACARIFKEDVLFSNDKQLKGREHHSDSSNIRYAASQGCYICKILKRNCLVDGPTEFTVSVGYGFDEPTINIQTPHDGPSSWFTECFQPKRVPRLT